MMKATIYSNEKKTFELVDDEDGAVLKVHSFWEAFHFAGIGYHLAKLKREEKLPEEAEDVHEQIVEDQPFKLGIGPFRFRIN
ncbi:MAG: hypothetical protein MUP66_03615 [Candidatus Nanohaloarchaeota archaeon QJJ-5]|nr:hypothetical protein [Candidatus Nanohaloarchaeota archaeon QJJ-5]